MNTANFLHSQLLLLALLFIPNLQQAFVIMVVLLNFMSLVLIVAFSPVPSRALIRDIVCAIDPTSDSYCREALPTSVKRVGKKSGKKALRVGAATDFTCPMTVTNGATWFGACFYFSKCYDNLVNPSDSFRVENSVGIALSDNSVLGYPNPVPTCVSATCDNANFIQALYGQYGEADPLNPGIYRFLHNAPPHSDAYADDRTPFVLPSFNGFFACLTPADFEGYTGVMGLTTALNTQWIVIQVDPNSALCEYLATATVFSTAARVDPIPVQHGNVLLTFDDLKRGFDVLPYGYGGLLWDGFSYSNTTRFSTYRNGTVSRDIVITTRSFGFGSTGTISSTGGGTIDLVSLYLTAFKAIGTVSIKGYVNGIDGILKGQKTVIASNVSPVLVSFDNSFKGIDLIRMSSSGNSLIIDNLDLFFN